MIARINSFIDRKKNEKEKNRVLMDSDKSKSTNVVITKNTVCFSGSNIAL